MARSPGPPPRALAAPATALALVFVVALLAAGVSGQGLQPTSQDTLGSSGTYASMYESFDAQFKNSRAWRAAFKQAPRQACRGSRRSRGSLCSAAMGDSRAVDIYAQLILATSPAAYSSLDLRATDGIQIVPPPRDQRPCATCTAFAVAAAAEAAVASVTGRDVRDVGRLSVQQLYFCGPEVRDCKAGWTLRGVLDQLKRAQSPGGGGDKSALGGAAAGAGGLLLESCLPYRPDARGEKTQAQLCDAECATMSAVASQGSFDYKNIVEMWQAQRHIRQYGAVVTRFDIFDDFKAFFRDDANKDKVYSPKRGAKLQEPHALALVGYNNDERYWIALNSWGPSFARGGTFKVAFGVASVLSRTDTYGVLWAPANPATLPALALEPSATRPGCLAYNASATDYLSRIAWRTGMLVEELLGDNIDVIGDLDAPLTGKQLQICGRPAAAPRVSLGASNTEVAALLAIKAAVDPTGATLATWTAERGAQNGQCLSGAFVGVSCDSSGRVARVVLRDLPLNGAPPPASALAELRALAVLQLANVGLRGTLPADWGRALPALTELHVTGNPGVTGPVPAAWARMGRLRTLLLFDNRLSGTLPPELGALSSLEELHAGNNSLRGPLPASWAGMRSLRLLHLYSNRLTGPLPAALGGGWAAIEEVVLSTNAFSGRLPPEWSAMSRLRRLDLFENQLVGTLPPQYGLGWLSMAELSLASNRLKGTLPPAWAQLGQLKRIELDDNRLHGTLPGQYGAWEQVTAIYLSRNALSGPLPPAWAGMGQLVELYLDNNALNGTLPAAYGAGLASLEELRLQNNKLAGALPDAWAALARLKVLHLSSNALTGTLPAAWAGGWAGLEELELGDNALTGGLPPEWAAWHFVTALALDTNKLSGAVPAAWGRLGDSLKLLWLANNAGLRGCFPPPGLASFAGVPETVAGTALTADAC